MKKLLLTAAALAILSAGPAAQAQNPARLYSDPSLPSQEVLDRLHLKKAWSVSLPMDGRRDGLYTVQIASFGAGQQVFVQTRSGLLVALDAATGRTQWSTRLGEAYRPAQPVAYNSRTVYLISNIDLFAVDRANGQLRWQFTLPDGASGPPVADDQQIYVPLTGKGLTVFLLPTVLAQEARGKDAGKGAGDTRTGPVTEQGKPSATSEAARAIRAIDVVSVSHLSGARLGDQAARRGPQPLLMFSLPTESRLELAPVLSGDTLLLAEAAGQIQGMRRASPKHVYRVLTQGPISVPPGQHDETAYVASGDFNVYAVSIISGRVYWRFMAGGPITHSPVALEDEVYVTVAREGLSRVDRTTGEEVWRNVEADRFLAANPKFVYATDRAGRLLVLDRARGRRLSIYEAARDFVIPVANEWTDRLFLAANNGLLVCLHDRDYAAPVPMKKVSQTGKPPKEDGGKPPAKPPEGGEEKKDKEKKPE